jgi:hypothetical protein
METKLRQIEAMITTIDTCLLSENCGPSESKYLLQKRDIINSALDIAIHDASLEKDNHQYHRLQDRLNDLKEELREDIQNPNCLFEKKEANRLEALAIRKEMTAIWNKLQGIRG